MSPISPKRAAPKAMLHSKSHPGENRRVELLKRRKRWPRHLVERVTWSPALGHNVLTIGASNRCCPHSTQVEGIAA